MPAVFAVTDITKFSFFDEAGEKYTLACKEPVTSWLVMALLGAMTSITTSSDLRGECCTLSDELIAVWLLINALGLMTATISSSDRSGP